MSRPQTELAIAVDTYVRDELGRRARMLDRIERGSCYREAVVLMEALPTDERPGERWALHFLWSRTEGWTCEQDSLTVEDFTRNREA